MRIYQSQLTMATINPAPPPDTAPVKLRKKRSTAFNKVTRHSWSESSSNNIYKRNLNFNRFSWNDNFMARSSLNKRQSTHQRCKSLTISPQDLFFKKYPWSGSDTKLSNLRDSPFDTGNSLNTSTFFAAGSQKRTGDLKWLGIRNKFSAVCFLFSILV